MDRCAAFFGQGDMHVGVIPLWPWNGADGDAGIVAAALWPILREIQEFLPLRGGSGPGIGCIQRGGQNVFCRDKSSDFRLKIT